MRILDRYILKSVVSVFFACILVFLFLYIIIDVFANLEEILKQQVNLSLLRDYYLSFLPLIFVQVAPIACLLATLFTFSKFNRNNEIIAMRASGLSIFQIAKTVIIFGLLVSIFIFWINDKFVPLASSLNQKIKTQMESNAKKSPAKEQKAIYGFTMYGAKNRLFYVNRFWPATNTMEGITILEHNEQQNITRKIVAKKGIYRDGSWVFYQAITYNFDTNGQIKGEPQYFDEEIMPIPESPQEFLKQRQRPDFMTIAQLDNYIWKLSTSGAITAIRNLKVDLYQKFTFPFTSLIIIFIGVPFSLMIKKRASGLSSLGVSITVGFAYYVLNAVSIALGKAGILAPLLAASLSHILMLTFSLYLIKNLP